MKAKRGRIAYFPEDHFWPPNDQDKSSIKIILFTENIDFQGIFSRLSDDLFVSTE